MASAECEPIMGSGAEPPAGSRGRAPGQGSGSKAPLKLKLKASIAGFERNWWSDFHECHLESFLVRYTTEYSFIMGVACGKKWGLRSLKALEFEKWGARAYQPYRSLRLCLFIPPPT